MTTTRIPDPDWRIEVTRRPATLKLPDGIDKDLLTLSGCTERQCRIFYQFHLDYLCHEIIHLPAESLRPAFFMRWGDKSVTPPAFLDELRSHFLALASKYHKKMDDRAKRRERRHARRIGEHHA